MGKPRQDLHDQMRLACEDAFLPYLRQVLEQNSPDRHAQIKGQFAEHMGFLADFCLRGYSGAGGLTVEFIKGLHRAMFPPDYRQEIVTRDGHKIWMVPGEFKSVSNNVCDSHLHPGKVTVFLPAEQVPAAMQTLMARINAELADAADRERSRDAILWFALDFAVIHPFVDSNGRVACILADLLAIRAGLPAFHFSSIKSRDKVGLIRAVELVRETRNLTALNEMLAGYECRSGKEAA
ncbi:MAG: Fic family protein [Gallionella sp.]